MLSLSLRTVTVTLTAAGALVACGTAQSDDAAVAVGADLVEQPDAAPRNLLTLANAVWTLGRDGRDAGPGRPGGP